MRSPLTGRALATVAAVATSAALAAPAAGAQSVSLDIGGALSPGASCEALSPVETEQLISEIHEETNEERMAAGRAPVQRLDKLEAIAGDWSARMAAEDRMYHNPDIRSQIAETFPGEWTNFGENVLQNWCGASGEDLVNQWMRSPGHRINLLDRRHTHLGVGAAVADSAKLYSTQNFVGLR